MSDGQVAGGDPFASLAEDIAPDAALPPTASGRRGGTGSTGRGRVPVRILVGLGLLVGLVVVVGGLLLIKTDLVHLPFSGEASEAPGEPSPTVVQGVAPAVSEPAPTPIPTLPDSTPVPTLTPTQVTVSGPGEYAGGAQPYVAQYRVALSRGEAVTVSLTCEGCLWPAWGGVSELRLDAPGTDGVFRVAVFPQTPAHFSLEVAGGECLSWDLLAGGEDEPFQGVCAPLP
jgi:hypothetical protein